MAFARRKGRAPILKYVDDWFTASKKGAKITGIDIVHMVLMCLGIPLDQRKTFQLQETLVVLGARLASSWAKRGYYLCVDDDKRKRWLKKLKECMERNTMDPGEASKMGGQFTWTTTTAANKVGRAFVKPLHAQAHRP